MNSKRLLLFSTAILVLVGIAAEKPTGSGVILLDHEKVSGVFAQGGILLATNNFKVMALRRNEPG
jgi:hypothetical protein